MKLAETVTFGGGGLDRAEHLRTDAEALDRIRASDSSRTIVFWRGKPLIDQQTGTLHNVPLDHPILLHGHEQPLFLGVADGAHMFSQDISGWEPSDVDPQALDQLFDPSINRHPDLPDTIVFAPLRSVMSGFSPVQAEMSAAALGLHNWHRSHRFCAKCGSRSEMRRGGWVRVCPDCDTMHFPRTDPVVIMLITRGENLLLGRSPHWPEGMYSLLAGFMEPGETLEAAVRREVREETGVKVGTVDYLASQPWPFPSSLMLGCRGQAITTEITLDEIELADARWVSKEELVELISGTHPDMKPTRPGAIARFLIDHWLADRLD